MRPLLLGVVCFGLTTAASAARAQDIFEPVPAAHAQTTRSPEARVKAPQAELVPVAVSATPLRVKAATRPLTGNNAWIVPGMVGVLVPLLLFALPVLMFAWFGPFAPVAFLVALVVAAVTTAAGGALAVLLSSLFTNVSSGFVLPIVASTAVGVAATLIGGVLATLVIVSGLAVAWFAGARPEVSSNPSTWRNALNSRTAPWFFGFGAAAFLVWGTSVLVAAIGGPMMAAYLYQQNGVVTSN